MIGQKQIKMNKLFPVKFFNIIKSTGRSLMDISVELCISERMLNHLIYAQNNKIKRNGGCHANSDEKAHRLQIKMWAIEKQIKCEYAHKIPELKISNIELYACCK